MSTEDNKEGLQRLARLDNSIDVDEAKGSKQKDKRSQQAYDRDGMVDEERSPRENRLTDARGLPHGCGGRWRLHRHNRFRLSGRSHPGWPHHWCNWWARYRSLRGFLDRRGRWQRRYYLGWFLYWCDGWDYSCVWDIRQ